MIREALFRTSDLPDIGTASALEQYDAAAKFLREQYLFSTAESERKERMSRRVRLYSDSGHEAILEVLQRVFSDDEVRKLRRDVAELGRFDNVLRRVVNEVSTVYLQPAKRRLAGEGDTAKFLRLAESLRLDERMRRADRMTKLCNAALLWVRVRELTRAPTVDVLTPDRFWAVSDPFDGTQLVSVILDVRPQGLELGEGQPAFAVWSRRERFSLNKDGLLLEESLRPNSFGRIPGILVHREPPVGTLLDSTTGDDLVQAHVAAWFSNTLLVKEAKSLNKQAAFFGDLSTTPTGQAQDTSADMVLGDGVGVQTIERGVDLRQFRETADHIIEHAASNHGIPPSVLRHEGASSGFEIELRRLALKEQRLQSIPTFRAVERELAGLMASVLAIDAPELAFNADGFEIDFAEVESPQDPLDRLQYWQQLRRMNLANTGDFLRQLNPDLRGDDAIAARLLENIRVETDRVRALRDFQAVAGAVGGTDLGDDSDE